MQKRIRLSAVAGMMAALLVGCVADSANVSGSSDVSGNSSSTSASLSLYPVANPAIEVPVTKGLGPFVSSTLFPLEAVGYTQSEYFLSGTASSYVSDAALTSDGKWTVRPASSASYKTRILVYRPSDAARFNGTVIVEWLNVSGGLDAAPGWINAHNELVRQGYAWVGVSAQKEGIDGYDSAGGFGIKVVDLPLKKFDAGRYGSLVHPGNNYAYDMFSQAAQAVRHPQGIDPLGGLTIKAMIATGESQSALRMTTYVNAIAPLGKLFDGFLIHSRPFGSAALSEAPQASVKAPDIVRIRDDSVPVMTVQTESDLVLLEYYSNRQDDSSNFRLWEIAGTAHADAYTLFGLLDVGIDHKYGEVVSTSKPMPGIIECAKPVNSGPQHFVVSSAYAALNRWVTTGVAPAMAPRLDVKADGVTFAVDANGNALGGIRTPFVDVPVATLSAYGQPGSMKSISSNSESFCFLFGTTTLFDSARLKTLYPTHASYVNAVKASADNAVAQGVMLKADAELVKTAAQLSTIGND